MEMNGTTVIHRPVEKVFDYVCDVANDVHWRTGVEESGLKSGDTLDIGTVGYARAGDTEVEWRVTSYVPGERVDWELLNGPFLGGGGYRLAPVDGGTEFTLVGEIEPSGVYKLLGPLFAWMGRRRNQADVEKLRDILEAMGE
jgi:hypothetical protein